MSFKVQKSSLKCSLLYINCFIPCSCIHFCTLAATHFSHIVALLEFTQQLYSVQENLGPLIVNLRLASSSPSLATNLPATSIQVLVTSSGGTAIGTCNSIISTWAASSIHLNTTIFLCISRSLNTQVLYYYSMIWAVSTSHNNTAHLH